MNYSRISRLLSGGLACCFAWTWVACAAAEKEPGTPKPAILIIDKGPSFTEHWNPLVLQEMLDCGFEVGLRKDSKLTWEELKQFNMALLVEPPEGCAEKICPLLERFMNEGGGVLIVPFQALLGSANVTLLPVLRWLKPLGAAVYALGIEDPERKATIDWCKWPGQPEYIWTSEMADSPITKGVKNLWYPTGISCSSYLLSAPIEIDKNWKPIVFTGPDSYAVSWKEIPEKKSPIRFINLEDYGEFIIAKGKKQGRQPLLAVRDYGKGKLAVFAVFPRDFLWCGYIPALDGVVLRKGFHGRPSDGWQLLSNLYRYLAAPSMKSGNLGGYKTVRDRIFHKTLHAPVPYDWKTHKDLSKREARTSVPRGLVGAHTSYSTGTGTVGNG
ncbi:MAG: hypothetical protein L6437_11160 [Kiritimatiellae bacterium]|nr:hypothetical protein [Kiritimatiellia bacterium]